MAKRRGTTTIDLQTGLQKDPVEKKRTISDAKYWKYGRCCYSDSFILGLVDE